MSAAILNAFHNVWLKKVTGQENISITANNHPLPRAIEEQVHNSMHQMQSKVVHACSHVNDGG